MINKFRTDINFLRAFSVLMVIFYHFKMPLSQGGFIGVDVFFVISGFLMTQIIVTGKESNTFNYSQFLMSRVKRIWPAMGVMLLTLLIAGAVILPPWDAMILAKQVLYAVLFISNHYYLGSSGYFAGDDDTRWLLHTWSLSVEWQFYMIYPFIIGLIYTGLSRRNLTKAISIQRGMFTSLVVLFLVSFVFCIVYSQKSPSTAFFALPLRAWEMIAGGLAFIGFRHVEFSKRQRSFLGLLGIAIIILSFFAVRQFKLEQFWPSFYAFFPVFGAFVLLIAKDRDNVLFNNPILQKIGLWSYSIYLWHWPLVIAFTITLVLEKYTGLAKISGVLISILLGFLSFNYVEKYFSKKNPVSQISIVKKSLALIIVPGIMAFGLSLTNGLDVRVRDNADFYAQLQSKSESLKLPKPCGNDRKPANQLTACTIDKSTNKKALVIGDSHAQHLYPWFLKKAPYTTDFFISLGCPTVPGFNRTVPGFFCDQYSTAAWSKALSGKYDVVFVSANWAGISKNTTGMCLVQGDRCLATIGLPADESPIAVLRAELEKAAERNIHIVMIGGTPSFPHSVPQYIYRKMYWNTNANVLIDKQHFQEEIAEFSSLFDEYAQKYPGIISSESLLENLCADNTCKIYDEELKMQVFHDKDHFYPKWIIQRGDVLSRYF